jgi:hypothetical protein
MKLRVFIGSSTERKNVVRALGKLLRPTYQVTEWYKDVFAPGSSVLPDLQMEVNRAHLAIFVYAPDDEIVLRKARLVQPRDNVIFELGMFMGKLGPRACFLLVPTDRPTNSLPLRIPSDLLGLTTLRYSQSSFDRSPIAALRRAVREFAESHSDLNTKDGARPDIAGAWSLTWVVESERFELLNRHQLALVQVGDRVLGQYLAHRKQGKGAAIPVVFDGTLREHILTGKWSAHGYDGQFQLQVAKDWKTMTGRWIGPSSSGGIKTGLYQWARG